MTQRLVDDTPRWMRRGARALSLACVSLVALAVVEQAAERFTDSIDNPWWGVALGFLSAAAIGVDAVVCGVRRVEGEGPSIRNLAPGGWAAFAAMLWIVAVPAYFFGARRHVADDDRAHPRERLTWGSWAAIAIVAAIGAWALLGVAAGAGASSPPPAR